MANFPTSLDNTSTLPNPTGTSTLASPDHGSLHTNENTAIIAVETKLGIGASTPTNNNFFVGTGAGTSAWSKAVPTGTVVGTTDSQTLTNKILTSPTINSPAITNASITADAITGFTTANTGSIYGIPVTTGVIQTANTVDGAALKSSTVTGAKIASYRTTRQDNTTNSTQTGESILTGWGVITPGVASSGQVTVTFGSAFTNRPIVVICGGGDNASATTYGSGAINLKRMYADAINITTTNFVAYVASTDGTNWAAGNTVFFQWIAIGT